MFKTIEKRASFALCSTATVGEKREAGETAPKGSEPPLFQRPSSGKTEFSVY